MRTASRCPSVGWSEPGCGAVLAGVACGAGAVFILYKWRSKYRARRKAERARLKREASFREVDTAVQQFKEKHPGTDYASILSLSLEELSSRLRERSLSPETVLHTYMGKALELSRTLNCTTGFLLESRDHLPQVEQCTEGLLYGVPVSIKDNVAYKGHDSSCGVLSKLEQPEPEDSVVVQVLKKQGAIPFVKTNIPQGMMSYDCSNPIYGRSLNPCNLNKTPGGSSGGEGALIGGGGSVLGLGTDIGGSIRIPASFCGICGLKPTAGRFSTRGIQSCVSGQKSVLSSLGPMARDVEGLVLCMKALLCDHMFRLDPTVPPIPFNEEMYTSSKPLRIGYYESDGFHMPSPSMSRAVRETKERLQKAGHTLIPFTPPHLDYAIPELVLRGILADGAATLLKSVTEGSIDPTVNVQIIPYKLPRFLKKIIAVLLKPLYPRVSSSFSALCGVSSIPDLWKQHVAVQDYCHNFISEWRKRDLDVLLCPMLGPAYNPNYCGKLMCTISCVVLFNLLNFPAGVVPVTTVTEKDEEELQDYRGIHGDPWDKLFIPALSGGQGLPIAVQCVALPWQDELCLRFMKEVQTLTAYNSKE
ncbi:fatty-acid amide hydrolase 1 [Amia ocellicauda]|uniref:fatty-acid amide hydrolase 1 n=1 Tax=Amia ocellicauda TaxID=2972642 RepID=UPI003463CBD7